MDDTFVIFRRIRQPRMPTWVIPIWYAASSVLLGLALPRIETSFLPARTAGLSSAAAMAIYSSIAAGMITLTGVVFSLVFVMVQFSATAYSPRLVLWMARDPPLFHAIGVFTATFLYAISAMAWVDRQSSGSVPFFSGWLVVGLLLASVGMFIRLVNSLNRLQIDNVLAFTGDFARKIIDVMYPPLESAAVSVGAGVAEASVTQQLFHTGAPRAIQFLDVPRLTALAEQVNGVIEILSATGETVVTSTPLLRVYDGARLIEEQALRKAIGMGTQRTFEQDPKYAIQILRDIAIRALSPAVNDPTTAVQALNQLEDLLRRLGRRRLEIGEVRDCSGRLRVVIPVPSWEDFLDLAFSEIRSYGQASKQVTRRMKALLRDLIDSLPEERIPAIRIQQKRLDDTIVQSFPDIEDQAEASLEDREGLGSTRRRRAGSPL